MQFTAKFLNASATLGTLTPPRIWFYCDYFMEKYWNENAQQWVPKKYAQGFTVDEKNNTPIHPTMEGKWLKKNWVVLNEKTGAYWSGFIIGGWTTKENAELFSSNELMFSLPQYGKWVNIEMER